MVLNQGLQGIAFFEATACLTLLVLFIHLHKDNTAAFYRLWLFGWISLTLSSAGELVLDFAQVPSLPTVVDGACMAALVLFLASIVQLVSGSTRFSWPTLWLPVSGLVTALRKPDCSLDGNRWETASCRAICLGAAFPFGVPPPGFRARPNFLQDLSHSRIVGLDRPLWIHGEVHLLRFALTIFSTPARDRNDRSVLESARSEEIAKMLTTILTATSSQSVSWRTSAKSAQSD